MQKHIAEILGIGFGLVSGIFSSTEEMQTVKLAALGAIAGFLVSKILKWMEALIRWVSRKLTRK